MLLWKVSQSIVSSADVSTHILRLVAGDSINFSIWLWLTGRIINWANILQSLTGRLADVRKKSTCAFAQTELADQTIGDDPRIADAQISIMGFIGNVGLHWQPIIHHFFAFQDFNSGWKIAFPIKDWWSSTHMNRFEERETKWLMIDLG